MKPKGQIAIQTLAMPANTNANGDIFGGWLVSQMDLAGGVIAKECAQSRITTVAIDSMVFHQPVKIGDLVCCYGDILKIGKTSMRILIEAWIRRAKNHLEIKVTEGHFTYVAINEAGKPHPVKRS